MFYEMNTNIMYEPTRKCSWSGKWLFSNKHEWNHFCCDYSDFFSEISVMLATQLMTRARGLPVDPWAWAARPPLAFRVLTPSDWSLVSPTSGIVLMIGSSPKICNNANQLIKVKQQTCFQNKFGWQKESNWEKQIQTGREKKKSLFNVTWSACQSNTVTSE